MGSNSLEMLPKSRREFLRDLGILGAGLFQGSALLSCSGPTAPVFEHQEVGPLINGYVYDPIFLEHTVSVSPEHAGRLEAIMAHLKLYRALDALESVPARPATEAELTAVHAPTYLETIRKSIQEGYRYLDPDTYLTPRSFEAATHAVGGLIDLTLAVTRGQIRNGFALVRPPGHHALPDRSMGFCLVNNVAAAARAAQTQGELTRVAIADFDVHHGNGTQAIFEADPSVFFASVHQHPLFPGTGMVEEIGRGEGTGATLNIPIPPGVEDNAMKAVFEQVLLPGLRRFKPELIIVSAGFDAHWADPLAELGISLSGFGWMSRTLIDLADELCEGRIVFSLEGGYNLEALSWSVYHSIRALRGADFFEDPMKTPEQREPDISDLLGEVKKIHNLST